MGTNVFIFFLKFLCNVGVKTDQLYLDCRGISLQLFLDLHVADGHKMAAIDFATSDCELKLKGEKNESKACQDPKITKDG